MHSCTFWLILLPLFFVKSNSHVVGKRSAESPDHTHDEKEQISLLFLQPTWFSTMFDSLKSVPDVVRSNEAQEEQSNDIDVSVEVQVGSTDTDGENTGMETVVKGEGDTDPEPSVEVNVGVDINSNSIVDGNVDSNVEAKSDVESASAAFPVDPAPVDFDSKANIDVDVAVNPLSVDVSADVEANLDNVINTNSDNPFLGESLVIPQSSTVEQQRIQRNVADFEPVTYEIDETIPTVYTAGNQPMAASEERVDGQWRPEPMPHNPFINYQNGRQPAFGSHFHYNPYRVVSSPPRFHPSFNGNNGPYWRPNSVVGNTFGFNQVAIPNRA